MHFFVEGLANVVVVVFGEVGDVRGDRSGQLEEGIVGEVGFRWGEKFLGEGGEDELFGGDVVLGRLIDEVLLKGFGKVDRDLHGGGLLGVDCFEFSGWPIGLGRWVSGRGGVVGLDVFKDFDFGGVGVLVDGGGLWGRLGGLGFGGWGVGDFVVVEFAVGLNGKI